MIIPLHNDLSEHVLRPSSGNAFELTVEQLATAIRLGAFRDALVGFAVQLDQVGVALAVRQLHHAQRVAAQRQGTMVTPPK